MRYGSVCSGIEAATVAWHPLGWKPAFFSEIDKFPRAVLQHHYPDVPLHGDFTTIGADDYGAIDLLVGGTPCQSFSIAGLRGGLGDDRGNLALEYLRLAGRKRPRWLAWENVPGVLSSNGGRDFGSILGGLVELGYGFAYRILDAQYVRTCSHPRSVPQRRRRVFVVGYLGDWRRAAAVLFDRESLSGNPPPRREAGQGVAGKTAHSLAIRGRDGTPQIEMGGDVANAILTPNGGRAGIGVGAALIAPTLSARPSGGGGLGTDFDLDGGLVANSGDVGCCLAASAQQSLDAETVTLIAFDCIGSQVQSSKDGSTQTLRTANSHSSSSGHGHIAIADRWVVRRLTPVECERLQGFPDDYTNIPWRGKDHAPDGPRYKALGNSMAVNVMRWIGDRIAMVDAL